MLTVRVHSGHALLFDANLCHRGLRSQTGDAVVARLRDVATGGQVGITSVMIHAYLGYSWLKKNHYSHACSPLNELADLPDLSGHGEWDPRDGSSHGSDGSSGDWCSDSESGDGDSGDSSDGGRGANDGDGDGTNGEQDQGGGSAPALGDLALVGGPENDSLLYSGFLTPNPRPRPAPGLAGNADTAPHRLLWEAPSPAVDNNTRAGLNGLTSRRWSHSDLAPPTPASEPPDTGSTPSSALWAVPHLAAGSLAGTAVSDDVAGLYEAGAEFLAMSPGTARGAGFVDDALL